MPRTLAFFGSSLVSAYWNGAATYYRGILKALAGRGYAVTFYEPDAYDRQKHRDIPDPPWARVRVYPAGSENDAAAVLEEAAGADVIVKASGVGVFDSFLEKGVCVLKRPGNQVVFWDVDAPATLDRLAADPNDPFRALVPCYDRIFTYGGGRPVTDAYLALGAKSCTPVYNAVDPDSHHPVAGRPEWRSDLGFMGNRLPDREARVDEFFLGPARLLPDKAFLLGGNGWEAPALSDNVRYAGHVYTRDHNAFNASCRTVLNISRQSMADYGFSPATRVFEAAGAGACLITDAWPGVEDFFEPGREILVARSGAAVAALVDGLADADAARIGQAARKRALADHTYDRRAATVAELLG